MAGKKLLFFFASTVAAVWAIVFYFIPAFHGEIVVEPGIHLGAIFIRYYGILLALAILACFLAAQNLSKHFGLSKKDIENALPWLAVFGFVGARLYFVIFSWQYFQTHLPEIFLPWKGGLSIYGAVIGGGVGLAIYAKIAKSSAIRFLDLAATVLPLGQAIGRFGNFFNMEAYGSPTSLPWKLYIPPEARPPDLATEKYFHPTFLYESLWDLVVFVVLLRIAKSKPLPGYLLGMYLILYSLGRFFVEHLRLDSFFWWGFRIDQITALAMMIIGLAIILKTHGNPAKA